MNILSVFDGISCGNIAMKNAGVNIDRYVAYEIDQYAIEATQHNFPYVEQMGDVFTADFTKYKGFDFLIGGSPCIYWSIAKNKDRETVASGMGWDLFSQYVRALKEAQPKYFIYENNKGMSDEIRASITETFGFDPICINSALVSAQARHRLYWVGRRNENGTYDKVDVKQPEDKGIIMQSIVDDAIALRKKARTVISSCGRTTDRECFKKQQSNMVAIPVANLNSNNKYKLYDIKDGKITVKDKQYPIELSDGVYAIRKLTVKECQRLQTIPEWYEFPISDSQAYKCIGNGWTCDVITHLIQSALSDCVEKSIWD